MILRKARDELRLIFYSSAGNIVHLHGYDKHNAGHQIEKRDGQRRRYNSDWVQRDHNNIPDNGIRAVDNYEAIRNQKNDRGVKEITPFHTNHASGISPALFYLKIIFRKECQNIAKQIERHL